MFSKGAPECHRSDEFLEQIKLNVKPSVDIWSFGGICSEAAVWVVLGMSGLNDYRRRRQQEIRERRTSQDGCCFHDGEKVLETVKLMHDRLMTKGEIRPGDHVTKPVLDQMIPCTLEEDPDLRHHAMLLWKRSKKIMHEAENKLKTSNQRTNPRESDAVGSNAERYDTVMPITPTHKNVQVYHENTPHAHGPPPNRSRHSDTVGTLGRPLSLERRLERRSDTWHVTNTTPNMAFSSLDGSPSPPMANHHSLGASPPVEMYSDLQGRPELYGTTPDETVLVLGGEALPAVRSLPHNSYNGSRNAHQSVRDFPPPENNIDAESYVALQSLPVPFRSNGTALEAQREKDPPHSNLARGSMGYEPFPTATDITSGKASQRPPPQSPTGPRMANKPPAPPAVETTAETGKPQKPFLSYESAKQIRLNRGALLTDHQALLNDLKNRDHVSS